MVVLKHIDVLSAARMLAMLNLVIGAVIAVIGLIVLGVVSATGRLTAAHLGIGAGLLIALPFLLAIFGFIGIAIETWIYNMLADKFGGVKLDFKKNRLMSIDPITAAKLVAIGVAIISFIVAIIIAILVVAVHAFPYSGIVAFALVIIIPIAFGLFAFIAVAISAVIYNYVVMHMGGIELNFKGQALTSVGIMSYAKVQGVLSGLWGLVEGVIFALRSLRPVATVTTAVPGFFERFGVLAIIVFPILYFVASFVVAFVESWLYNWLVPHVGGVKVIFSKK